MQLGYNGAFASVSKTSKTTMIKKDCSPRQKPHIRLWHIELSLFCLLFFGFVFASIFLRNGSIDLGRFCPQPLKVMLTPDSLAENTNPTETEIYDGIRQLDDMTREIYKIDVESSQGGNQLFLFCSSSSWQDSHNRNIYIIGIIVSFLIAVIIWNLKHEVIRVCNERQLAKNMRWIIIIGGLICVVMAITNLSVPYNRAHEKEADPFFVLMCWLCIFSFMFVAGKMLCKAGDPKFYDGTRLTKYEHRKKVLILAALSGWILGFLVFFIGMYTIGTQKSLLTILLRPALAATKMFVLADSPGDLSYVLRHNGAFMGFYSFTKLYVLLVTSISLLSLIWHRISNYFKIKQTKTEGKNLYVFFGVNDNSRVLAQSIKESDEYKETPDNHVLLFVESNEGGREKFAEAPSVSNFFGMFTHRREAFDVIEDLDALLLINNTSINGKDCTDRIQKLDTCASDSDIWEDMGMEALKKYIINAKKVHILFISDEEKENIQGTANVNKLLDLCSLKDKLDKKKVTIYCHARYEKIGRTFDAVNVGEAANKHKVKILDSSQLAVQTLIMDKDSTYHPVNYVDVDTATASVKSPFNACVIGFGETGHDMVKFIYEFGAFLDYNNASTLDGSSTRSPFFCDIYDDHMEVLEQQFKASVPVVNKPSLLHFNKGLPDLSSETFINELANINYITISLGNDEQNMSMLSNLMEAIVRVRRTNLDNLVVLVRNYSENNTAAMERIQDYYNSLLGDKRRTIVKVFGQKKTLFSYRIIIGEEILAHAKKFYKHYSEIEGSELSWEDRHYSPYDGKGSSTLWEKIASVERKESQDINNFIHISTKLHLIGIKTDEFKDLSNQRMVQELNDNMSFPIKDGKRRIEISQSDHKLLITNLAKNEHLRWMASHEMMGYQANEGFRCDELSKTHNCLVPWEKLNDVSKRHNDNEKRSKTEGWYLVNYQAFDFMVVKTSFEIMCQQLTLTTAEQ